MNARSTLSILGVGLGLALFLAGCATGGPAVTEVNEGLSDFEGVEITTEGEVKRGVPVSSTDLTAYQFGDDEQTVAVLSPDSPENGETRTVTARVVPFTGEEDALEDEEERVREEITAYLEESGVGEDVMEAATSRAFELVRTFTVANSASFFLLEQAD